MSAAQAYHGRGNDPRSIDIFSDQLITYHKALEEVPQVAGQAAAIVEVVRALDRFQPDDLHIQDIDEVVLRTLRVATDASEVCYVILTGGSSEQRRDTFLDEQ